MSRHLVSGLVVFCVIVRRALTHPWDWESCFSNPFLEELNFFMVAPLIVDCVLIDTVNIYFSSVATHLRTFNGTGKLFSCDGDE